MQVSRAHLVLTWCSTTNSKHLTKILAYSIRSQTSGEVEKHQGKLTNNVINELRYKIKYNENLSALLSYENET